MSETISGMNVSLTVGGWTNYRRCRFHQSRTESIGELELGGLASKTWPRHICEVGVCAGRRNRCTMGQMILATASVVRMLANNVETSRSREAMTAKIGRAAQ